MFFLLIIRWVSTGGKQLISFERGIYTHRKWEMSVDLAISENGGKLFDVLQRKEGRGLPCSVKKLPDPAFAWLISDPEPKMLPFLNDLWTPRDRVLSVDIFIGIVSGIDFKGKNTSFLPSEKSFYSFVGGTAAQSFCAKLCSHSVRTSSHKMNPRAVKSGWNAIMEREEGVEIVGPDTGPDPYVPHFL